MPSIFWLKIREFVTKVMSQTFLSDGSVRMIKAQEEPDIDSLVDSIMNQYEDALKDLVDL
ncbi:TPA: hypothetical protein ACF3EV_000392 [Enterococcus faecium]